VLKNGTEEEKQLVLRHPKLTEKHIDHVMENGTEKEKRLVLDHKNCNMDHINMGLKDSHPDVQLAARLRLPNNNR
jgi:hypothetical protein